MSIELFRNIREHSVTHPFMSVVLFPHEPAERRYRTTDSNRGVTDGTRIELFSSIREHSVTHPFVSVVPFPHEPAERRYSTTDSN